MTVATGGRIYQFTALTDLWTGGADGKPDRLISTGLLGSIRWWFEVLVRGLGGGACDPTDTKCEDRNHCVVCELFGCTGWARKFRFEVLDENGNIKTKQIKGPDQNKQRQGETFSLRFTPLRPIGSEEWALLNAALHLIAEFGAIGGKTVFKPTDESSRTSKLHHKDYGLVEMATSQEFDGTGHGDLKTYLSKWRKPDHDGFAWASLQYFWCVNGKYLGRQDSNRSTFNLALGRQEAKNQAQQLVNRNDQVAKWLAGSQQESKRIFSFKKPARTFGFVKPDLTRFAEMKKRLREAWPDLQDDDFHEGPTLLNDLLQEDRS